MPNFTALSCDLHPSTTADSKIVYYPLQCRATEVLSVRHSQMLFVARLSFKRRAIAVPNSINKL